MWQITSSFWWVTLDTLGIEFFCCLIHFPSWQCFWHSDSATQCWKYIINFFIFFLHKKLIWSPINHPQMCTYLMSTPREKYNLITTLNCTSYHGPYLVTRSPWMCVTGILCKHNPTAEAAEREKNPSLNLQVLNRHYSYL